MSPSERDAEICTSIMQNLGSAARQCDRLAAGYAATGDLEAAADMHLAALRYRQVEARVMGIWAEADALEALRANTTNSEAFRDAPTIVLEV